MSGVELAIFFSGNLNFFSNRPEGRPGARSVSSPCSAAFPASLEGRGPPLVGAGEETVKRRGGRARGSRTLLGASSGLREARARACGLERLERERGAEARAREDAMDLRLVANADYYDLDALLASDERVRLEFSHGAVLLGFLGGGGSVHCSRFGWALPPN